MAQAGATLTILGVRPVAKGSSGRVRRRRRGRKQRAASSCIVGEEGKCQGEGGPVPCDAPVKRPRRP